MTINGDPIDVYSEAVPSLEFNRIISKGGRVVFNNKDYGVAAIRSKPTQIRVLENNKAFNEILMKFIKIFVTNQFNNLEQFFKEKYGRPGRHGADPNGGARKSQSRLIGYNR